MRLVELDPRWLVADGARLGFVFLCPHCRTTWLSCFTTAMPHISGQDYHDCQAALFAKTVPEVPSHDVVPCKRGYAWSSNPSLEQATFESLSITPSIDASAAGHWHGFITGGEIR